MKTNDPAAIRSAPRAATVVAAGLWLAAGMLGAQASSAPLVGPQAGPAVAASTSFDAVPFGFLFDDAEGPARGVRWAEPRKVRRVEVELGREPRSPEKVRLQYWHRTWDGRPEPILAETGAGGVGWAAMDDWTNGAWKDADARILKEGRTWTFEFAPTGEREFPRLGQVGVAYRRTLKVRLLVDEPETLPSTIRAFTDSVLGPLTVRIEWGKAADPTALRGDGDDAGRLEAWNGAVLAVRELGGGARVTADRSWTIAGGAAGAIEADLLVAADPADPRYDRAVITVRSRVRPFSFAADDVLRNGRLLLDDLGVLVARSDDRASLEECRAARGEFAGNTVYRKVLDEPEQTLARAWDDMPLKRPLYFVHGLPGDRNCVRQDPNGDVGVTSNAHWFRRLSSPRDSARKLWSGDMLWIRFGLPRDSLRGGRELADGYLPEVRTWWQDGPLHYEQRTVLDALDGDLSECAATTPPCSS